MQEKTFSASHVSKYGNLDYEGKLRTILIQEKGLDPGYVNSERDKYLRSTQKGYDEYSDFPNTVNVELINKCNYKCSMCYTVNHEGEGVSIDFADYKKIIDECEKNRLLTLFIANGSEPLIFKGFRNFLEYATQRIPDVAVFTNGLKLDRDTADFLIDSGVTRVNISLDAATRDTYTKIRGGNLDIIEDNIHYLLSKKTPEKRPLVRVSFCVQEENLTEVNLFKEKWDGKVDSIEFQSLHKFDSLAFTQKLDNTNAIELHGGDQFCSSPSGYIAIWSNGDMSPCCSFFGQKIVLGNIENSSIKEAWLSNLNTKLKEGFQLGKACSVCSSCLNQTVDLLQD